MSSVHSHVRPGSYLFLRLPSETLRVVEVKLNTIIDVGKLGSFPANLLVGRPYYHTYELLEKRPGELYSRLRTVPPAELHAESALEDAVTSSDFRPDSAPFDATQCRSELYDVLAEDGSLARKNNRLTIDDASRQQLSQAEIEELKKSAGGKEVVKQILANHAALDEKTVFAKAKYTLRKHKKYLKRFAVQPMDLGTLIEYIMEKEAPRIMEMREETLGLVMAWSNAHFSSTDQVDLQEASSSLTAGRWLVCDETGGLVVAAIAERMGLLYPPTPKEAKLRQQAHTSPTNTCQGGPQPQPQPQPASGDAKPAKANHRDYPIPAATNTITLLHSAVQPNLSLLKYFGYDTSSPIFPSLELEHPLHTHLNTLSWLQLLHPDEDPTYHEPEQVPESILSSWKSGKRGSHFKKRRRWARCKNIVDDTRKGGFEGLVIASHMDPTTILKHTVPLIRGGGHLVIYSPILEPLASLADLYSKERRGAYIAHLAKGEEPGEADFPLDPRLLLAPTIQTIRVRQWQVLPGRTHPLMTARGGAEGYVFTARRVIPLEGGVEARGHFAIKRRKTSTVEATSR